MARALIFEQGPVNFAVKHEDEFTLLQLLHELERPRPDYSSVAGLFWKAGDRIVENLDRPLIPDLDNLPFPQ